MDVENLAKELILKNMTPEQQMAVLDSVRESVAQAKEVQKRKIGENVDLVVQALKKIESDITTRFESVGNSIEKRVLSIKDGRDGSNGKDGRDGKDGKSGKDGLKGDRGLDGQAGRDGVDGVDGISVVNANIDFDGSLIISLSDGREINVGEVVSADVAEKIKVISTMSTNAAIAVKEEGTTLTSGVKSLNFVGTGITATTSGDDVTVTVSGGSGTVTSVAATVPAFLSVTGSPITTSGTLAIGLSGTALPVVNGGTGVTTSTGTGNAVLSISPTLTTPALGTPSALVGTNITGTATNFTASNVTTNANLTGDVTSVGNASTLATVNTNVGSFTNASLTVNGKGLVTAVSSGTAPVTSVTGTSPVASSGGATPAISLAANYGDTQNPYASKTANFVLAAPNGSAGAPTFRAIVAADVPTLNQNTTGTASNVTGTVAIANGGSGQTTASAAFNALSPITTAGDLILGNGSNSATRLGIGSNNTFLVSNGTTASWSSVVSQEVGQCRLVYTSATVLTLIPHNGRYIKIAGSIYEIPSAGVTVTNSGLSASTLYYIYASISGGNVTLSASATTYATDSTAGNIGVKIRSGNNAFTLVGMIYTNGSSQFVDTVSNRQVLSYFNRLQKPLFGTVGNSSTTSTSQVITSSAFFTSLNWADEGLSVFLGAQFNTTGSFALVQAVYDSASNGIGIYQYIYGTAPNYPATLGGWIVPAEGLHTYYIAAGATSGSGTVSTLNPSGTGYVNG
jgi:hypothetical protein